MTARDPDIAALAKRLGLRGLRYRSFAPPAMPAPPPADIPVEVETAPVPLVEPTIAPAATVGPPVWQPPVEPAAPPPAWPAPVVQAAPPAPAWQPPPAVEPPTASATFPLLGSALAAAARRPVPIPDTVPEAARPFAALRLAVAGPDSAPGI